jgi:hypothetical protein
VGYIVSYIVNANDLALISFYGLGLGAWGLGLAANKILAGETPEPLKIA